MKIFLMIILLLEANLLLAQKSEVIIPSFNDKYCNYVKLLERGKTDIDYTDFRNSFLESQQYAVKGKSYDSLKEEVYEAIKNKNYDKVISLTKAMLSIDYTSMFANKYLQQTYKIIGDSVNKNKYHDIEFGLLNSIMASGDGKTCETGWHVTQIEEEYFILKIVGATFQGQSLISGGDNICDKMMVKTEEGGTKTYFFEINLVIKKEKELLGEK